MTLRPRYLSSLLLVALPLCTAACVNDEGGSTPTSSTEPVEAEPTTADAAVTATLESLLRQIERGKDIPAAKAGLDALLDSEDLTPEQRIDVRLAQSRAFEEMGDDENAIVTIEAVLSEHGADSRFVQRDEATKRLRRLLTGTEDEGRAYPRTEPVAPVAKALAKYFPLDDNGAAQVDILTFGPDRGYGDRLGIYNLGSAHRETKENECPLCEENVSVHMSKSSSSSWTSIPMTLKNHGDGNPHMARSAVFFFFDLEAHRVPARYDAYLPIPSAEIVAELEKGNGLIAAREREGAPPIVVLAAPRQGQLEPIFEAFSHLDKLPSEPMTVEVDPDLTGPEIQNIIRTARGKFRGCYEELLKRDPEASGKISIHLQIDGKGQSFDVRADGGQTDLADETLEACLVSAVDALEFPASGQPKGMTVTYPLVMTPD